MTPGRRVLCAAALGAAVMVGGCVSEQVGGEPLDQVTLTVVRSEDRVLLTWEAKAGQKYTVLYSATRRPNDPWQPLPQALNLSGAGQPITVEDRIPAGRTRYYRLHRGDFPPAPPAGTRAR
ncbi:MAG: hypothetical protein KA248_06885 [Kiritimatiellae bacterium]|nr:hypothetical protein [Kiritimatiellia bacterium]